MSHVQSDQDASIHDLPEGEHWPRPMKCGRAVKEGETWWKSDEELTCEECAKNE